MSLTVYEIREVVAAEYGVHPDCLESASQRAEFVEPRHVAMYITYVFTGLGVVEIGKRFGGRDCTTVRYSVDQIGARLDAPDAEFDARLLNILKILENTEQAAAPIFKSVRSAA